MVSGLSSSKRTASATSIGPRGDPSHFGSLSIQQSAASASPFSQATNSYAHSCQPSNDSIPSPAVPSPQVPTCFLLLSYICAPCCVFYVVSSCCVFMLCAHVVSSCCVFMLCLGWYILYLTLDSSTCLGSCCGTGPAVLDLGTCYGFSG